MKLRVGPPRRIFPKAYSKPQQIFSGLATLGAI